MVKRTSWFSKTVIVLFLIIMGFLAWNQYRLEQRIAVVEMEQCVSALSTQFGFHSYRLCRRQP